MKLSRISRLLELLAVLQGGKGHNADSLSLACGVSRRTIFRDLNLLRQVGVPLDFNEEDQRYAVRRAYVLPPTQFTADEALALMLLCYELGDRAGVPFCSSASSAALKLESNLPARLREHVQQFTSAVRIRLDAANPLTGQQPVYRQLLSAVAARRSVRIQYDSLTEWKVISTKLNPYRLLFSRRSWYVIGRSSLHREPRTFNVSRILELEQLDERYQIPRGFSLERYLRNAWHLIPEPGPDSEVVVRFQPLVARNVAEVAWHKTQRTVFNADETMDFHVTVSGLGEIAWWILGYGDQAEVLKPPELRQTIVERATRMLARYQGQTSKDVAK